MRTPPVRVERFAAQLLSHPDCEPLVLSGSPSSAGEFSRRAMRSIRAMVGGGFFFPRLPILFLGRTVLPCEKELKRERERRGRPHGITAARLSTAPPESTEPSA